jgi:Rap1a immunity proteins
MRMLTLAATTTLALGCPAGAAKAGFWTGNDFFNQCTPAVSPSCYGYVGGVSDAIAGWGACLPSGVTVGQAMDLVVQFLNSHQQQWNLSAAAIVTSALSEAFPCKQ